VPTGAYTELFTDVFGLITDGFFIGSVKAEVVRAANVNDPSGIATVVKGFATSVLHMYNNRKLIRNKKKLYLHE